MYAIATPFIILRRSGLKLLLLNLFLAPTVLSFLTVNKSAQSLVLPAEICKLNTHSLRLKHKLERCHTVRYSAFLRDLESQSGEQRSFLRLQLLLHVYNFSLPAIQAGVLMIEQVCLTLTIL
jgi:hypothetical protein